MTTGSLPTTSGRARREYRSKRRQPCEPCRESKSRCPPAAIGPTCQRCLEKNIECYFRSRLSAPTARSTVRSSPIEAPETESFTGPPRSLDDAPLAQASDSLTPGGGGTRQAVSLPVATSEPTSAALDHPSLLIPQTTPQAPEQFPAPSLNAQISQTLDNIENHSVQIFGSSSDADPWLLRHMKFDDYGLRLFHNVHFRHAGGVPTRHKIPIHFHVCDNQVYNSEHDNTQILRTEIGHGVLNDLIPPEHGPRLIVLFCKHVFPFFPVISRSGLGITSVSSTADPQILSSLPVHLLAAIYASALPFVWDDSYLSIVYATTKPDTAGLWRVVFTCIVQELHRPQLTVIQAALMYLHKKENHDRTIAMTENHFLWSLMGSVVGMATSLGLHIECQMWAIPAREKRIRRRLWWAVYSEDKWRSLLCGRPPYIRQGEWDTSALEASDFFLGAAPDEITQSEIMRLPFLELVRLAVVAEQIYDTFYMLRAAQIICENFNASLQAARPLLEQLVTWHTPIRDHPYPASVQFAYLILMTYIYRALVRTMVPSADPPEVIDMEDIFPTSNFSIENNRWTLSDLSNTDFLPADNTTTNDEVLVEETLRAAQNCGATLVSFLNHLTISDLSSYWLPWSTLGFSTASNFIVLLLVQAPTPEHAARATQLLDPWWRSLRHHKISGFGSMMDLGLMRLNTYHMAGLQNTFLVPSYVGDVLDRAQGGIT